MASPITPIQGRYGQIVLGGAHLYLEEWSAQLEIENERFATFESTASPDGLYWKDLITNFASGKATIKGHWDATPGADLWQTKSVKLDAGGTGFLGLTSTVGLNITFKIVGVNVGTTVNAAIGATFEANIEITYATFSV